jgi:hypothetical protein
VASPSLIFFEQAGFAVVVWVEVAESVQRDWSDAMKIRPLLFTLLRACPIFGYFWNNYAAFAFVGLSSENPEASASVCVGLIVRFWLWVDTPLPGYASPFYV